MDGLVPLRASARPSFERLAKRHLWANVTVLTGCNRRCPDCCMGDVVLRAKPRIFTPESIARDIAALGEVAVVVLTGGEPTLHPDFPAVAAAAREARGPGKLMLITNGARLVRHAAEMRHFDVIRMSVFTEDSHAGEPTDPDIADSFRAVCPPGVSFEPSVVVHYRTPGGGEPCERIANTVSTMDGRLYACCVAAGIDDAPSIPLTADWYEQLPSLRAPCDRCVFGE